MWKEVIFLQFRKYIGKRTQVKHIGIAWNDGNTEGQREEEERVSKTKKHEKTFMWDYIVFKNYVHSVKHHINYGV